MVMPAASLPQRWTRAMLDALPEDGMRHEIIDGVHFVSPAPSFAHQYVVGQFHYALQRFLETERVGWVVTAPCDVVLADDTVVQPDLLVVRREGNRPPRTSDAAGLPMLAAEVVSPSSSSRDRIVKRPRYARAGIAEYWIVDPLSRLVERWRPGDERPEIITDTLVWQPSGAERALRIPLESIFEAVTGEAESAAG